MSEIQRADPESRRRIIIFSVVILLALAPILFWLNSHVKSIEDWIAEPGKIVERVKFVFSILIALGVVLLFVVTIFAFRFASAVLKSDRYPPPDVKVIRDTRIRRGAAARKIGRFMQAYGVVVLLFMLAIVLVGWKLMQNVEGMAG